MLSRRKSLAGASLFSKNAEGTLACVFSLSGLTLTVEERALFRKAKPFGYILFARNCENPEQVTALIDDLKQVAGRDCPILIDQEGGRVQRLKPPHWTQFKPMKYYGDLWLEDKNKARLELRNDTNRLAEEIAALGINVSCAPVLDVLTPKTHQVIGDRAFSDNPESITDLGLVVCEQLLAHGITPVIKHMPGHGRAVTDSHDELPVVDASFKELEIDFRPFKEIAATKNSAAIWGMPSPVLYPALDSVDAACASQKIIDDVIRGYMDFQGIVISDALDMKGFDSYGNTSERMNAVLAAGCDLALHCTGKLDEMEKIAENCPKLTQNTLKRLQKADKVWNLAA